MSQKLRAVLDTNVVVSGLLFPGSVPARAILRAQAGTVLSSESMRAELLNVFARSRFDRYANPDERMRLAKAFVLATEEVIVAAPIRVCREPRDDKFLEAAVHGRADLIVTGDRDLLALDPFHSIRILTPAASLES